MVQKMLERALPNRKTSLFFSLLIFAFADLFLWFDKIGSSEWMTVSLYLLTAYVIKRHKSNELYRETNEQ